MEYRQARETLAREREEYWKHQAARQHTEEVHTRQKGMLIKDGILYRCIRDENEVCRVPEGVYKIWPGAFLGLAKATAIHLPDSVTEIGKGAFESCRNLVRLILPKGLEEIPEGMCRDCSGLKSLSLPDTVIKIDSQAFYGCTSLEYIGLSEGLRWISKLSLIHI